MESLKAENIDLRAQNLCKEAELAQRRVQSEEQLVQICELKTGLDQRESAIESLRESLSQLESLVEAKKKDARLQTLLDQTTAETYAVKTQLERCRQEKDTAVESLEAKIKELSDKLAKFEEREANLLRLPAQLTVDDVKF